VRIACWLYSANAETLSCHVSLAGRDLAALANVDVTKPKIRWPRNPLYVECITTGGPNFTLRLASKGAAPDTYKLTRDSHNTPRGTFAIRGAKLGLGPDSHRRSYPISYDVVAPGVLSCTFDPTVFSVSNRHRKLADGHTVPPAVSSSILDCVRILNRAVDQDDLVLQILNGKLVVTVA
jgi:hypothetical protein